MQPTPIFKGATRPACVFGVPMKPFLAVTGLVLIVSLWTWIPLAFTVIPLTWGMRAVTQNDDQKFRQLGVYLRFRLLGNFNRSFWRGACVFRAGRYRRRK